MPFTVWAGRCVGSRTIGAIVLATVLGGCADPSGGPGDPAALRWVSPSAGATITAGDALQLAVSTTHAEARVVRFAVDGREVGVCDGAGAAAASCRSGALWRSMTTLEVAGRHRLAASFDRPSAPPVRAEIEVVVTSSAVGLDGGADSAADSAADSGAGDSGEPPILPDGGPDAGPDADAGADGGPSIDRGFLDPDLPFHNMFGGIEWAVRGQEIVLRSGTPSGSVAAVVGCMARFGDSIRRWADRLRVSRAAVVATVLTESSCTNPMGSSDGLSSGPMQVTATTCAGETGLSASTCRTRMYTEPDFSFQVGVGYIASSFQRRQHNNDPPKIAAAYNAGTLRSSTANRWHLATTGNHLDRFASFYNAYRAWERDTGMAALVYAPTEVYFEGEHVARVRDLPARAREGQTYFVGDWPARDGDFYVYAAGAWRSTRE